MTTGESSTIVPLSPRRLGDDAPADGDFRPVVAKHDPDQAEQNHGRQRERIDVSGSKGLNRFKFLTKYGQNTWYSIDSGRFWAYE